MSYGLDLIRPKYDLYIQAFPGRAVVEVPELGLRDEVRDSGFDHPRMPLGDWTSAHAALVGAIKRLRPSRLHKVGRVLFHIQHEWEGGISEIELRAIKDLSMSVSGLTSRLNVYTVPAALSESDVQRLLQAKPGSESGLSK